jgi:predicted ArsR family transcriptional regulator
LREYQLAAGLLVQAVAADQSGHSRAALDDAARQLGTGLGERYRATHAADDGPWPVLESALSEHGFEPRHDGAGTVRMRNCPFRRLAELQPEVVCHMNLALIQGLVAGLSAGSLNPVHDPQPEYCCVAIPTATP